MQTFLPVSNFRITAEILDRRRLGKQRVEALQILRALKQGEWTCPNCPGPVTHFNTHKTGYHCYNCEAPLKRTGWYNHPAVLQWRGFSDALKLYGITMCLKWISLGFFDTSLFKILYAENIQPSQTSDPNTVIVAGGDYRWRRMYSHSQNKSKSKKKGNNDEILSSSSGCNDMSKNHRTYSNTGWVWKLLHSECPEENPSNAICMGSFVITSIYFFNDDFSVHGYEEKGSTIGNRLHDNSESVLYETRNLSQNITEAAKNLLRITGTKTIIFPDWFGDEQFHLSHQSNLLRKDYEHYSQFFMGIPDDIPYVWPVQHKRNV